MRCAPLIIKDDATKKKDNKAIRRSCSRLLFLKIMRLYTNLILCDVLLCEKKDDATKEERN